jgi:hypothetical protein
MSLSTQLLARRPRTRLACRLLLHRVLGQIAIFPPQSMTNPGYCYPTKPLLAQQNQNPRARSPRWEPGMRMIPDPRRQIGDASGGGDGPPIPRACKSGMGPPFRIPGRSDGDGGGDGDDSDPGGTTPIPDPRQIGDGDGVGDRGSRELPRRYHTLKLSGGAGWAEAAYNDRVLSF